jgi:hypothetical protein
LQDVPPTEPTDEGDEGEWDTVGEPTGDRSSAPTVEELLAHVERQPPAPHWSTEQERRRVLHRLPLLQKRQRPQRRKRRRPPRLDW